MKKLVAVMLSLSLVLVGCVAVAETAAPQVELTVFAAINDQVSEQIAEMYKAVAPNVTLVFNFDSSGTLQTQIEEGAEADVFISAGKSRWTRWT